MDLYAETEMTFTLSTTRHPTAILSTTLAILTAHRAGTARAAPSPEHSLQVHTRRSRNFLRNKQQKIINNGPHVL